MREPRLPLDDLGKLAEREMDDKREDNGNEGRTRELYDVPTESVVDLEDQQAGEEGK